jgi:hypothetical protein
MDKKYWDKEAVYDEQIAPLMTQIIKICKEHEIPLVAVFQYLDAPDEEGGPGFCSTLIPTKLQSTEMRELNRIAVEVTRKNAVALAITETTEPDGKKHVRISRVV